MRVLTSCFTAAVTASIVSGPAARAAILGICADGRFFTIDGEPTFLNGISYYGAQSITTSSYRTDDLNDMVADGFNWMRVWAFWEYPDPGENVSVMTQNGSVREAYMSRLKTLISECNSRGIIVDVSLRRDSSSSKYPSNQSQHLACVQTLANELLAYRNVYIDVSNERDVMDSRHVSLPECGELIDAIKAIDADRLCTASSKPTSQSDLQNYCTQGHMDFITPHLGRHQGASAETVGKVEEFIGWMSNLGFRAPVHLQEPFRRGYTGYNPTVEDFYRDCSGGKTAEAAGWCLHNGDDKFNPPDYRPWRCFSMSDPEGRIYSQWDGVEQTVSANIDNQIGGTSTKVRRYQAEYSEQLAHQIGRKEGFTWSANVSQDDSAYLNYGPYIKTVPAGGHLANWRMRIDNNSGNNDVVVRIDVVRNFGGDTLAAMDIGRQDFNDPDTWQEFLLAFDSNNGDNLEFRTYWYDKAKIDLDQITLTIGTSPLTAFTDITGSSGTGGPSHFGGHGVMWADVTGDSRPDLYVTMIFSSPMAELFYRNVDGTSFTEEAAARGIDDFDGGSHGASWGDLDNDGDYDLANGATYYSGIIHSARNEVYENNGSGSFTNRTSGSGLLDVDRGTRAVVLFDYDLDGDLDILCNNWEPDGEANELYRNDGSFQFTSITGNGLGTSIGAQGATEGDFDNDGDLDLLLCRYNSGFLLLMRNDSGTFTQLSPFGATSPRQDGATFCDVNNDGWLDVHAMSGNISGTGQSWLFINNQDGSSFTQVSVPQGPGFMAGFEDLDNDGDWDMVYSGDNKVYLNDGSGSFTASASFSVGTINDPRAVAFADIDGDGDMDFFYAQKRTYNMLIRNDLSDGGNWLSVRLISPNGQAGAFGAKVKTYESGQAGNPSAMICFREARSNEGYLGQNDPVLHFGVGARLNVDVQVTFPGGVVLTQASVAVNQTILIDASPLEAPVIAEVSPDPDSATAGVEYLEQLVLAQGSPPVTWSVVQAPAAAQVNNNGLVTGWTPEVADTGQLFFFEVQAANAVSQDTESWNVRVTVEADFDGDGDVDQEDFGLFQACLSGSGQPYEQGCEGTDLDGDGDVDVDDFALFQACMGGPNQPPAPTCNQ